MFQRKRKLKKEKTKLKIKRVFMLLFFLVIGIVVCEYLLLNFSFGRNTYLNPISKNKVSSLIFLESELERQKIPFSTVSASPDGSLIVNLNVSGVVILSSKKDIRSQISSLQLILSRLTIEGKKLKSLDFRYDNPVVLF